MAVAAPSFVIPANVAENARFLAGRVDEVALCFFESRACLAYGPEDLPENLADLPLKWHIHLPFDLPWQSGEGAAQTALAVADKVSFLPVKYAVLHPPGLKENEKQCAILRGFHNIWRKFSPIKPLLENTADSDLCGLEPDIWEKFGLCLDIGHLLGYKQKSLLSDHRLLSKAVIAHWSAPGSQDQHLPLTMLAENELCAAKRIAALLPPGTIHVLEIFNWHGVESSIPMLAEITRKQ